MDGAAIVKESRDDYLDILGQQPGLNIYTQIVFCFGASDDKVSQDAILDILTKGLERLSASFPWVAGQVVNDGAGFKIVPFEKLPRLVVKDLSKNADSTVPTMDALRGANFPFSMLDENLICPRHTLPTPEESADAAPVLILQVSFIVGGLLLTFNGQHNTMDMTGQGQVIRLFSKACLGQAYTPSELSSGNLPRSKLIPFLENYTAGPEVDRQIIAPVAGDATPASLPAPLASTWANFTFPAASLTALKSLAMQSLASGFVSTDDTLTAFIWQRVSHARLARFSSPASTTSTFARAVDVRTALAIPATYPGLVQNMTYAALPLSTVASAPLGELASALRKELDPAQLALRTRALATVLDAAADKTIVSFVAGLHLPSDIMLSSWAKLDCYELDFGFGRAEAVRRPRFTPVESLMYLLPRDREGGIAAAACLRDEDLERLRADEVWRQHATYVG